MKTKQHILTTLVILFTVFSANAQTASPPTNGNGTSDNPYQIATLDNLYWLSQTDSVWDNHLIQTANINAANTKNWDINDGDTLGFFPIGNNTTMFTGTYNGQGHTIDSLNINRPDTDLIGLFGRSSRASIENLGVINLNITGNRTVGGIVGLLSSYSSLTNCFTEGNIFGRFDNVGGLVGNNTDRSVIYGCYSKGNVTIRNNYNNAKNTGGLVGNNDNSTHTKIINCYSTCNIIGNYYVGGLVGNNSFGTLKNNFCTGNVSGNKSYIGGFIGKNYKGEITNSYCMGDVTRKAGDNLLAIGAFCGSNFLADATDMIKNCYCTGSVYYEGTNNPTDKGFIGISNSNFHNGNFYDITTSNQNSAIGATAKTTADMKTPCIYLDSIWDFMNETANGTNNYWGMNANENDGYPFLEWQGYTNTETCVNTNIKEINNSIIVIYPNPAEDNLHLVFENKEHIAKTVEIIDISGKRLKQISIPNKTQWNIDVSELRKGIYFLKIRMKKTNKVLRFVKK